MSTNRYRILALDGGARGVLMTRLLRRLLDRMPDFLDKVDLFTGNSAGAMTTAILLSQKTLKAGLEAAHRLWSEQKYAKPAPLQTFLSLTGRFPFSSNAPMLEELEKYLGDTKLKDLSRNVVFPAFQLDNEAADPVFRNWTPRLFHNLPLNGSGADDLLREVVMRSGSAPIASPAFQGYIDGGIFANNPSLCALALAKDFTGLPVDQIEIFSVGMGQNPVYFNKATDNLGYADWMFDPENPMALLNAVGEANLKAVSYQCGRILESGYYRLDPRLPRAFVTKKREDFGKDISVWDQIAAEVDLKSAEAWLTNHGWHEPKSVPVAKKKAPKAAKAPKKARAKKTATASKASN